MCESLFGTIYWAAVVLLYVVVGTIAFVLIFRNRHLQLQLMKLETQRETGQQQQYPNANISHSEGTFESEPQDRPEYSPE